MEYESVDWWQISGTLETVEYNYLPLADCPTLIVSSQAPHFTIQPEDQIGQSGETITFLPTITGDFPREYQWYANDAVITGETSLTYSVILTTSNYDTAYKLTVSNAYGETTSSAAYSRLTPTFTTQPIWNGVVTGGTAIATVVAVGSGTIGLQWYKGEELLIGKTSSTLTIENVQEEDGGEYYCIANSEYGTTQSSSAWLYVNFYFTVTENSSVGIAPYFAETTSGVTTSLETELASLGLEPYCVEDETGIIMSSDTETVSIALEPYFVEETST